MPQQPSNLKAALWMAGSIASFLAMSIAGRATTAELNVFQVLEMRSVIGFIMLLPLVYFVGGFAATYLRRGNIVLIPIRLGVGWRQGVNLGYMKFSHKSKWFPF